MASIGVWWGGVRVSEVGIYIRVFPGSDRAFGGVTMHDSTGTDHAYCHAVNESVLHYLLIPVTSDHLK